MTLLEALAEAVKNGKSLKGYRDAGGNFTKIRTVHFVFAEDGSNAFISEIEHEELVPLLEQWCSEQRSTMGSVH